MVDSGQALGENFSVHLLRVEKKYCKILIKYLFAWVGQWTSLWRKTRGDKWECCVVYMFMKQQSDKLLSLMEKNLKWLCQGEIREGDNYGSPLPYQVVISFCLGIT